MQTLITTTVPHRTDDLSRCRPHIRTSYPSLTDGDLSTGPASAVVVNACAMTLTVEHAANAAIDAAGTEQWMTFAKFGPTYHSQRWRFAP